VSSINHIAWMWDEALQVLEQAERRRRQFAGLSGIRAAQPVWEPPTDVFESESQLTVIIALPGVSPDAVTVEVIAEGLVVSAERPLPAELESMRIGRLEIPYGRFERHLALARGTYALAERQMRDGCLVLRLRKE